MNPGAHYSERLLVLATRNRGKSRELEKHLKPLGFRILSLKDFPDFPPVVEDGESFEENAVKKALETARATGLLSLADDSGLEVDALGGAPGVRSARFAGEGATDSENNEKLLSMMRDVPEEYRGARFVCKIALADPEGAVRVVEGSCEGVIARKQRGSGGFGYDPLFVRTDYGKTFAELDPAIKNRVSHRARAMERAVMLLEKIKGREERI